MLVLRRKPSECLVIGPVVIEFTEISVNRCQVAIDAPPSFHIERSPNLKSARIERADIADAAVRELGELIVADLYKNPDGSDVARMTFACGRDESRGWSWSRHIAIGWFADRLRDALLVLLLCWTVALPQHHGPIKADFMKTQEASSRFQFDRKEFDLVSFAMTEQPDGSGANITLRDCFVRHLFPSLDGRRAKSTTRQYCTALSHWETFVAQRASTPSTRAPNLLPMTVPVDLFSQISDAMLCDFGRWLMADNPASAMSLSTAEKQWKFLRASPDVNHAHSVRAEPQLLEAVDRIQIPERFRGNRQQGTSQTLLF